MNKLLVAVLAGFLCAGAFAQTAAPTTSTTPAVQSPPVAAAAPAKHVKKHKATAHRTQKPSHRVKKSVKKTAKK